MTTNKCDSVDVVREFRTERAVEPHWVADISEHDAMCFE